MKTIQASYITVQQMSSQGQKTKALELEVYQKMQSKQLSVNSLQI